MILYDQAIASNFHAVNQAVHQIDARIALFCKRVKSSTLFKINFMLREMLNNAVEHGNHFDEDKCVYCRVAIVDDAMLFTIQDEGSGVDLTCDPFKGECEFTLSDRNRGFATVRELNFDVAIDKNVVTITLDLRQEGGLCEN